MAVTAVILALGFVASTILRMMWAAFLIVIDGIDRAVNPRTREQVRRQRRILAALRREMSQNNTGR